MDSVARCHLLLITAFSENQDALLQFVRRERC